MPSYHFNRSFRSRVLRLFLCVIFVYLAVTLYHFMTFTNDEHRLKDTANLLKNIRLFQPAEMKTSQPSDREVKDSATGARPTNYSSRMFATPEKSGLQPSAADHGSQNRTRSEMKAPESKTDRGPKNNSDKDTVPIILWWNSPSSAKDYDIQCGKYKCRNSNNKMNQNDPNVQAFLFYGSSFEPHDLPLPRLRSHLWGLYHEESPKNARFLFNTEEALSLFNYTATFRQESDFPLFSHYLKDPADLTSTEYFVPVKDKDQMKEEHSLAPIVYVQSDCGTHSDRDTIVTMLQRYIRIDSYGKCLHNREMPEELQFKGSMQPLESKQFIKFMSRYKFTLAIENYVCKDYVTEKFWRALRVGSVPIVFGAPNIKEYFPNNKSGIVIEDFQDIPSLAKYISFLDSNISEYQKYIKHKVDGFENKKLAKKLKIRGWSPKGGAPIQSDYDAFTCFMCEKVHEARDRNTKPDAHIAKFNHYGCPEPKRFDENGKYVINNKRWAYDWNYAKYLARAVLHFSNLNIRVNESELEDYAAKLKTTDYNKLIIGTMATWLME